MFEVGFTEIVLILGLALLVLGPEKLPGLAEKVGRWTGRARAMARQLRTQLEQEVSMEEMAKSRSATPPPAMSPEPAATTAPSDTPPPPYTTSPAAPVDAEVAAPAPPTDRPHHANAGLDLETMVSGMEPPPQAPVETPAPTKAAH
ncbi:MAG: Sec-independent protein translocase protein TatB [Steroidobacter sp.]